MHILIINASPYCDRSSFTSQIAKSFQEGVALAGSTTELYSIGKTTQWHNVTKEYLQNENIVFVVPVYVGIVPSILKEFLEKISALDSVTNNKKKISFVLHSAFPESSQRRCCEAYLETFVNLLNCEFCGILSGSVFYGLIENKSFQDMFEIYRKCGEKFVENNATFFFEDAVVFNGVEQLTEQQAKRFVRYYNFLCRHTAEEKGSLENLYNKPYEQG